MTERFNETETNVRAIWGDPSMIHADLAFEPGSEIKVTCKCGRRESTYTVIMVKKFDDNGFKIGGYGILLDHIVYECLPRWARLVSAPGRMARVG